MKLERSGYINLYDVTVCNSTCPSNVRPGMNVKKIMEERYKHKMEKYKDYSEKLKEKNPEVKNVAVVPIVIEVRGGLHAQSLESIKLMVANQASDEVRELDDDNFKDRLQSVMRKIAIELHRGNAMCVNSGMYNH